MTADPRGLRFVAGVTTVVLAAVLISANPWVLVVQTAVFAIAAIGGVNRSPYGWVFRRFIRPRLGPPADMEDARPPRFAQAVGLTFAALGLVGYFAGWTPLGIVATAFALAAAFLNAAFGFCLGCEMYLLLRRIGAHRPLAAR